MWASARWLGTRPGGSGFPDATQEALYHVYESWVGGWVPEGRKGDDIAIGSRVARAAMDAAFFGQLGGVDAAVFALRQRAGVILDPAVVATFVEDRRGHPGRGRPR